MEDQKKTKRNDSLLNTGLSSAIERRARARAEEQKQKRGEQRAQLTPGAEIIVTWIDQEIKAAADLREMIINVATEEHVKAQLLARQYHLEFLTKLKARAKNTLREAKKVEKITEAEAPEGWKETDK